MTARASVGVKTAGTLTGRRAGVTPLSKSGRSTWPKHLLVEEKQGAERLVLGGSGHLPFNGQMGQEGADGVGTELIRVALAVEEDEAA